MSEAAEQIRSAIENFEKTEESRVLEIQLSLTRLVIKGLKEKGWTHSLLARELGFSNRIIERLLHGDENWTVETAGKILFALGIKAELKEVES